VVVMVVSGGRVQLPLQGLPVLLEDLQRGQEPAEAVVKQQEPVGRLAQDQDEFLVAVSI
jgi:hypothetical protein